MEIYNCLITFYHSISKQIKQSDFISKEIKQYTEGNKIQLKGNKILGLVIFCWFLVAHKTYGPMRWLSEPVPNGHQQDFLAQYAWASMLLLILLHIFGAIFGYCIYVAQYMRQICLGMYYIVFFGLMKDMNKALAVWCTPSGHWYPDRNGCFFKLPASKFRITLLQCTH